MSWIFQLRAILMCEQAEAAAELAEQVLAGAAPLGPPTSRVLEPFREAEGRFDLVVNWDLDGDQGPAFDALVSRLSGAWSVERNDGDGWHGAVATLRPSGSPASSLDAVEYLVLEFQSPRT